MALRMRQRDTVAEDVPFHVVIGSFRLYVDTVVVSLIYLPLRWD